MPPPLVQLTDIRLSFGGAPLLDGVELSVSAGERVCLVGRNGSGKSTLLKIAAALIEPDSGQRFVQPGGDAAAWKWRPALNLVEVLRETKDETELAHIRAAVQIAEHALARTLPRVKAGMTELEVAGILELEMRLAGSERTAFETSVAAGARSALPHARASAQATYSSITASCAGVPCNAGCTNRSNVPSCCQNMAHASKAGGSSPSTMRSHSRRLRWFSCSSGGVCVSQSKQPGCI